MRRIDELHLEFPFAGSRMLRALLRQEGIEIGRQHVATLMKMAIEAIYRRPNTSKPTPGHKIYPYLLRKLPIVRPNQVWVLIPREAAPAFRNEAAPLFRELLAPLFRDDVAPFEGMTMKACCWV